MVDSQQRYFDNCQVPPDQINLIELRKAWGNGSEFYPTKFPMKNDPANCRNQIETAKKERRNLVAWLNNEEFKCRKCDKEIEDIVYMVYNCDNTKIGGEYMPRKRDRVTEKCQWSMDVLDRAIKRVNDDRISLHKAVQEFKIPYSTLQKRYRRLEQTSPRLGRKSIFSPDQERILADHLIHMTNLFYGLDSMKFRQIAYECAE
ncbi:hypothetical protein ILUMI_02581 [Ignelater luminosus]|uniref:HTH psq-type domain-containing protein n=1 Tax=Ignelater luminosus TaxID=2038154 RepID=A0A8K0DG87_IGNLU|nr:hypothetical protein ILUMI_02581 [Ignelater luminosus]